MTSFIIDTDGEGPTTITDGETILFSEGSGLSVTRSSNTITFTATLGTDITAGEIADGDHGDFTYSGGTATIDANAIALTTDTTGNYAAGDAEAGAALTGDSATNFFSTGTIEDARLSFTLQDAHDDGGCTDCITANDLADTLT